MLVTSSDSDSYSDSESDSNSDSVSNTNKNSSVKHIKHQTHHDTRACAQRSVVSSKKEHRQKQCHNGQSEIDVFEIDGVEIDIDTYLEETEDLIEDMRSKQSHSHDCGCTTDTTTAQMNSLSTHDDKQKEGVSENKSDTLPSRCGQSDKKEDSEQCFSYLKDKHKLAVRHVGNQFTWTRSSKHLRQTAQKLVSPDVLNTAHVNRIITHHVEEHCSNTDDYYANLEPTKVYQMHGLSLYCTAMFMNIKVSCLTDCGAGVNLISKRLLGDMIKNSGKHITQDVQIVNDRLVVSVANEKKWTLRQKAIIRFKVAEETFKQTFWVTEKIEEDVFFGIPALREMSASINIANLDDDEGDYLVLRKTGTKVPLDHFPSGVTSGVLALSTEKPFTLQPFTGATKELVLRPGRGFMWPEGKPVTGVILPAPQLEGDHLKPVISANLIDPVSNTTTVILQNDTPNPITYYPGCTVAFLEPVVMETEKNEKGDDLLYLGVDDKFHRRIHTWRPNVVGGYSCMNSTPPAFPVPLASVRRQEHEGEVTETIEPLSDRSFVHRVRKIGYPNMKELEEAVDTKVTLPDTTSSYSYKDCNVNESLSQEDRQLVDAFLKKHQVFFAPITQSYPNPNMPDFATQVIKMKQGHLPFASRAYPMSQEKSQRMKEILDGQLRKGMISPSQSPYASPAFLVPKPGGKWRLVVDMRKLNKMVEKSTWPIPRIYEILDKLAGSHFFSTLDLVDGFHQCTLHEDSRKYTAFITAFGTYEYNTTPMGLITSPNHFQFVMQTILAGKTGQTNVGAKHGDYKSADLDSISSKNENLIGHYCFLYIDDLLVFSKSPRIEDHLSALEKVINRLQQYGLRAKATKAHIAMTEVKFLGWMLNKEGRSANPEKTKAIDEIPVPKGRKSKSQLSSFLGLASFYRTLIENFSKITARLYNLLKVRGTNIEHAWTDAHQADWEELKEAFKSEPILIHPDYTQPFIVKTDCSKTHAGAILCQIVDGHERVVEYASTKLDPTQKKWHLTHLEGFAIVWALKKWRRYLEGRHDTKVITDHKALLFIRHNQYSDASHKLIRWMTFIDTFDVKFEHRHDVDHGDVDALTRMYEGDPDIVWSPEDPTADWIFDLLADYLPKETNIQSVDLGGPTGSTDFNTKFRSTSVAPDQIRHYPKSENTVMLAVPPSTRAIIKPMFEDLYELKCKWAVWCPLKVLQASYFKEPDTQLIVIQGPVGYGSTRRGAPERGAWITHGLGLKDNIFIRSTIRNSGPHFRVLSNSSLKQSYIRSVKADWTVWEHEALQLTESPVPHVTQIESRLFQAQHDDNTDFEHITTRFLKKFTQDIPAVNSFKSSWDRLSKVSHAYCSHNRVHPVKYTDSSVDMHNSLCRSYTSLPHPSVRAIRPQTDENLTSEEDSTERTFEISDVVRAEVDKRRREIRDARDLSVTIDKSQRARLRVDLEKLQQQEAQLRTGTSQDDDLLPMTQRSIRYFQQKDPECASILSLLSGNNEDSVWANLNRGGVEQSYTLRDGTIYVQTKNKLDMDPVLLVPKQLRNHLLQTIHRGKMFCHPGQKRMYAILRKDFWWPNMHADVKDMVKGCLSCSRSKAVQPKHDGDAVVVVPDTPFSVVGVDLCGPFPKSNQHDYRHIAVFVDHYSRWIRLVPLKEATAVSVSNALLKSWVRDFGTPELLVSDSGSQFTADVMTDIGLQLGIKMHAFPAESQWRNGKVERVNRYIKERLRIWKRQDYRQWPDLLPFIEMSHHFTTMPQYGLSPYEILFGMPHRIPFSSRQWTAQSHPKDSSSLISMMHERIHKVREDFQRQENDLIEKRLKKLNRSRKNVTYEVGEKVMVFTKGTKNKLVCLWSDQATIASKVNSNTYTVLYPNGSTKDISTQRLRKVTTDNRTRKEVLGPFTTDYPHFMEGDSKGKAQDLNLDLLDREVVHRPPVKTKNSYRRIDQRGNQTHDEGYLSITYGQHVAYNTAGGWKIGQYLGDHPDVPKNSVKLRAMNVLTSAAIQTPRQATWRYEWEAQVGRNVVAPLGKQPHEKPHAKNTGKLTPLWVTVSHKDIHCTVTLTKGRISSYSWRQLSNHIRPERIASLHLLLTGYARRSWS